jgi:hypothetical protein
MARNKSYYKITGVVAGIPYGLGFTDDKKAALKYFISNGWKRSQIKFKRMGLIKA